MIEINESTNTILCSHCGGSFDEYERRIYIKHDGSLNDGMEIVTHPMTLDYHLNEMPWREVMSKAISFGYISHKTRTC